MEALKDNLKAILGLPPEAKVKGIIYRKVKRNSDRKYPAVIYELDGSQHIKHINKKLREELRLDTVSNRVSNSVSNHEEKVSNQYLTSVSNQVSNHEGGPNPEDIPIEVLMKTLRTTLTRLANIYAKKPIDQLTPEELKAIPVITVLFSTFLDVLRDRGLFDGKV